MTDENGLKPARPVAPRSRISANPQMAQPLRSSRPTRSDEREIERAEEERAAQQELHFEAESESPEVVEVEVAAAPVVPAAPAAPVVPEAPAAPVAPVPVSPPAPEAPAFDFPKTVRATLARVDQSWAQFRAAALRFPSERMDERLGEDAWTRKQMLEHVAAWHDLTADRLVGLLNTGAPVPLDRDTDQFNASVARRAIGKSSGEVLQDMDATFNRLRRQMARLTDAHLAIDGWWAAYVIGGNTYGHYEEHWADIYTPELPATGARSRR